MAERFGNAALIAVNASYSHSSLSLRCLRKALTGFPVHAMEFTINDRAEKAAAELYRLDCDLYAFSCYIWNIEFILDICRILKVALPDCAILLGGPEVSYDAAAVLSKHLFVDYVLCGEGELSLPAFVKGEAFSKIDGLAYRETGEVIVNPPAVIADLDALPRLYSRDELAELEHKMVYYETSRGCPFRCSYCLSSTSHGVRFYSLERVFADFMLFMENGVRLVKLVDRTFNIDRARTKAILRFILANNKNTCFHFEVAADILDDETISLLTSAPKGMFQLEIGVQSTYTETLCAIDRKTDFAKLKQNVKKLQRNRNMHLHLDLIAGLPHEGYERFTRSFDDVFALRPDMLQLGFLKLLRGTKIRLEAGAHGYQFCEKPPYEVLSNAYISYGQLLQLKGVEEIVERYYNSGAFEKSLAFVLGQYDRAYTFFDAFSAFWQEHGYDKAPQSKRSLYDIFYAFYAGPDRALFGDLLKFDYIRTNKDAPLPHWAAKTGDKPFYQRAWAFIQSPDGEKYIPLHRGKPLSRLKQALKVEKFNFDVCGGGKFGECAVLFDYEADSFTKIFEKF